MKRLFDELVAPPYDRKKYRVMLTTDLTQDARGIVLDASARVARFGLNRFEKSLVEPEDTLFEVQNEGKSLWRSDTMDLYIGILFGKGGVYKEGKQYLNWYPARLELEEIQTSREGNQWGIGEKRSARHKDHYRRVAGILSYLCSSLPSEHIERIESLLFEPVEELRAMERNEISRVKKWKADTQP